MCGQGAESEVEQLGLEPAATQDADIANSVLTRYVGAHFSMPSTVWPHIHWEKLHAARMPKPGTTISCPCLLASTGPPTPYPFILLPSPAQTVQFLSAPALPLLLLVGFGRCEWGERGGGVSFAASSLLAWGQAVALLTG